MTFAELTEDVLENLGSTQGHETIARGEVKRRLNLAMREVSLHVGIPTIYVDVPTTGMITGAFQMPVTVHPEGIKYAEVVEVGEATSPVESRENFEIAILSVAEANMFHPKWEDDDYCDVPFLRWSPANPDAGILPVGITTASYRFLVHANPNPMVDDTDEPFSVLDYCDPDAPVLRAGAMPAYHRVLAHFVSHELLQRLGDQKWQAYYARYQEMRAEMYSQVQPVDFYYPTMRTSRRVKRYA